jgi:hypothetical protein
MLITTRPLRPAFNLVLFESQHPVQMYLSDAYTIAVNLAGLPSSLSHRIRQQANRWDYRLIGNFLRS